VKKLGLLLLPLAFSFTAYGAACPNGGTLQQYIDLSISDGGCDVGPDFIMSNWAYLNVSLFTNTVAPEDITVNFSFNGNGVPQLNFASSWLADVNLLTSTGVGLIAFSLEARDTNFNFTSVELLAEGSVSNEVLNILGIPVPTALATVTEVNCAGGLLDLRDSNNLLVLTPPLNLGDVACNGGGLQAGASAALAPGTGVSANALINLGPGDNFVDTLKIITVSDLLNVGALGIDGRAEITSISQNFDGSVEGVPEPGAFILTGVGLAGLGLIRNRRQRRAAAKAQE